jgi:hypothetical protein
MDSATQIEKCEACGVETTHNVSIEIIREGEDDENGFSREPYRIAECVKCGTKTQQRVNNI